jgi:hypothetical protein
MEECTLTRTGSAHNAQQLPVGYGKGDIFKGLYLLVIHPVTFTEALYRKQWFCSFIGR